LVAEHALEHGAGPLQRIGRRTNERWQLFPAVDPVLVAKRRQPHAPQAPSEWLPRRSAFPFPSRFAGLRGQHAGGNSRARELPDFVRWFGVLSTFSTGSWLAR